MQQVLLNTAVLMCAADLGKRSIIEVLPLGVCVPLTEQLLVNPAVLMCTAELGERSIIEVLPLGVCTTIYSGTRIVITLDIHLTLLCRVGMAGENSLR